MDFSLVLPCFNEEKNIRPIYDEFIQIPLENYKCELIYVNNGSLDNTSSEIDIVIDLNNKNKSGHKTKSYYFKIKKLPAKG